ncbi:hypothetical protein EV426DRAFT_708553 [Tirmania nivea]|nr:hypothetical protein EV426DRAFT_708553 [Tirmania nivea]
MRRAIKGERKALVNFTRCRTGKGDLLTWRKKLDPGLDNTLCRGCGRYEETGENIALVCSGGEGLGRRFGNWEEMDDLKRTTRRDQEEGVTRILDLAESFFGSLPNV